MLRQRERVPELMDQPGLDASEHRRALDGLGRINRASRTAMALWPAIRAVAARLGRPVRVLDLACGGGQVALDLAAYARAEGVALEICGCDTSPLAVGYAQDAALRAGASTVAFRGLDVLHENLPDGYDVVVATLFLHHLSDEEAAALLLRMSQSARHLVLVSDLRRTLSGFVLAWVGCRLLSRSPVVHVDGPRSVRAAFRTSEVRQLAARAGLAGAKLEECWPQRFLLSWRSARV
jgi:2-polyprenyl-3-methyl-5-hydroxy-6-metoxy-1,4-benzoquinol methylase